MDREPSQSMRVLNHPIIDRLGRNGGGKVYQSEVGGPKEPEIDGPKERFGLPAAYDNSKQQHAME
jgi:hypothetical protein